MIEILNVMNFDEEKYDEAWLTVRAVKHPVEGTKHVPALSPSKQNYHKPVRRCFDLQQKEFRIYAGVWRFANA